MWLIMFSVFYWFKVCRNFFENVMLVNRKGGVKLVDLYLEVVVDEIMILFEILVYDGYKDE